MFGPDRTSDRELSRELGLSRNTLSRWRREASTVLPMGAGNTDKRREAKSTRSWTLEEKLRVVLQAAELSEEELGVFLRREGLHQAQLVEWRKLAEAAFNPPKVRKSSGSSLESKRIRELEKELHRKEKALAELAALLALKKKVDQLWGDEDESTPGRSDG